MTKRIMAIIEKSATDIVRAPIIKADVRREGARSIDTAYLEIPAGYKVSINDTVSYIQDDVPVDSLFALWNFQGSYRDEGGYHHDGKMYKTWDGSAGWTEYVTDDDFVYPNEQGNGGKYRTNYGAKFTAAGKEIKIEDNTSNHTSTNSLLDFTGQFDIIINFKNMQDATNLSTHFNGATNNTMILFSKYDTTNSRGVQIGLKVVSNKLVVYAKLDSTTFTGDATLYDVNQVLGYISHANGGVTRMIRFYRDNSNVVRLLLDNNIDGANCKQTPAEQLVRVTEPAYIGTNNENVEGTTTNNYDFKGFIFQVRIYCGGYLKHGDVETLISAGVHQMTQKLSGNVWTRKDTLNKIKLDIKSRSRTLLDTNITYDIINNNLSVVTDSEPATHTKNVFDGGQEMSKILKTIVSKIDSSSSEPTPFIFFRHPSTDTGNTTTGRFLADGNFVKNVETLMILSRRGFLTFPTKTFLWEYGAHEVTANLNSGYTFSDSEYQMYGRGESDFNIINDVEVYGDLQQGYEETSFGNPTGTINPFTTTFSLPPKNLQLVIGSSIDSAVKISPNKYWVDPTSKQLYLTSTSGLNTGHTVFAKYNYDITTDVSTTYGGTADMTRHYKHKDNTSIGKYGKRSARIYIPQLLKEVDFQTIAQKIVAEFKDEKRRYEIKAPFLINCLRENLGITLSSTKMKFTNSSGAEADSTKLLGVKSIRWEFPEMITTIEVGDYDYDLFDVYKVTSDTATSASGSIIGTRSGT